MCERKLIFSTAVIVVVFKLTDLLTCYYMYLYCFVVIIVIIIAVFIVVVLATYLHHVLQIWPFIICATGGALLYHALFRIWHYLARSRSRQLSTAHTQTNLHWKNKKINSLIVEELVQGRDLIHVLIKIFIGFGIFSFIFNGRHWKILCLPLYSASFHTLHFTCYIVLYGENRIG